MSNNQEDRSALALAIQWASRVMTVSAEMVVPGLAGLWLDGRLGTRFALGIVGFMLGMTFGIWHLLRMTAPKTPRSPGKSEQA